MQMVFNFIDYKDPGKIFYCFVKIKEDHTYESELYIFSYRMELE